MGLKIEACGQMLSCFAATDDKQLTLETSPEDVAVQNRGRGIRKPEYKNKTYHD